MARRQRKPFHYIDTQPTLDELVDQIRKAERIALDTEANSLYRYHERVCLIQLSLNGDNYIVDPLARTDLSRFLAVLAATPLVLHGADYDLRMMRTTFEFRPQCEVFDTMIASQLLGYEGQGLASLVEQFVGRELSKRSQKADWTRRPLPFKQLTYAADDTRYLDLLANKLRRGLRHLDRLEWHRESCRRMVEATATDRPRDREAEWRLTGTAKLGQRQLAYVRQLWHWRESEARRADRPPFKIVGNGQLLALANWAIAHPNGRLSEGPRLPRTCRGRRMQALESALRKAAAMPSAEWPERRLRRPPQPREPDCARLIKALQSECSHVAEGLDLPPQVIAPKASLIAISRARPRSMHELRESGDLMQWQAELLWPGMQEILGKAR